MKARLYRRTATGLVLMAAIDGVPDDSTTLGVPYQALGVNLATDETEIVGGDGKVFEPIGNPVMLKFTLYGFDNINQEALFVCDQN